MTLGSLQAKWPKEPTANQTAHAHYISEACERLREAMHNAEGSMPPGEHQRHIFQTYYMILASQHLETAEMHARKAALE